MDLPESTVRGIDLRYLERCEAERRRPVLRQIGVDEIYQGKKDKFLTVVCEPSVSLRSQGPKDQRRGRGQFTVRLLAGDRQLASL
jgi:hypothetical protein